MNIKNGIVFASLFAAIVGLGVSKHASAQAWPANQIHLVVPFTAGGPTDTLGRYIAEDLRQQLGQVVIVDNKGGAGGTIGAKFVARSKPDGYTFLLGSANLLAKTPPIIDAGYEPLRDLAPVAELSDSYLVVAARKNLPAKSLSDLQRLAQAKKEGITCGSAGLASPGHFLCAELGAKLGVKFLHVPFKGISDVINALLSDSVDIVITPGIVSYVKSGGVQALAAGNKNRHPTLPNVPSMAESGVTLSVPVWFGISAPAGTPREIINKVSSALQRVIASDKARETFLEFDQYPAFLGPDDFASELKRAEKSLAAIEVEAGISR